MKCESCAKAITEELAHHDGIRIVDIDVPQQRLLLELSDSSPSAFTIQALLENKLKLNTIIRGTGNLFTAVSELRGSPNYPGVIGVARFVENESKQCLLDAVIDGLESGQYYQLGVHQYGDLSESNLQSIGEEMFPFVKNQRVNNGRWTVKKRVDNCDLPSFIGRAFAVRKVTDSFTKNDQIVGAGLVARASKVMDNSKRVCACSGKTLWEERNDNNFL